MLIIYSIKDSQGFKLFLRVAWEPFEEEFQSMETCIVGHINIVVRLANAEHQVLYKTESQENQRESQIYIYHLIVTTDQTLH